MSKDDNVKRCERCGRRIDTKEAKRKHLPHEEPSTEPRGRGSARAARRRAERAR